MRSQSNSQLIGSIRATIKAAWITSWMLTASASAGEWPCWRGSRGDGVSEEANVPIRWSSTENVAWKVPIPGVGHSSPVIWGDRIFVTTYIEQGNERVLMCLDRLSGKRLWEKTVVSAAPEKMHNLNRCASGTPATDGQRVWVAFLQARDIVVVCYDMTGKELWRKSPGTFASVHGFCSSPVPYKNSIILNCDQDAPACIVALDKITGREIWRTDRPNRTRSYCTPTIFQAAGKPQMVLSGSKCVASYDPDTGNPFWLIDGPTEQFVAGVVFTDDIFFVTGGFPDLHIVAIRPDGTGNVTDTHIAWRDTQGVSYVPSPIAHGKYFFVVADRGLTTCFEAKTGKRMWQEKLGRHHSASAVAAGGYLYFLDDDGKMFVLKAGPKFELVARNDLGEECYASPAISRGQIFIRTLGNLYCLGKPVEPAAQPIPLKVGNFRQSADEFNHSDEEVSQATVSNSAAWDSFSLDQIPDHRKSLTILFDETKQRDGQGKGLRLFAGGKKFAASEQLMHLTGQLPSPTLRETSGGWQKYEGNPVMGGQYGTCFDVSVMRENGAYRMWLSWRPKKSVALVESKDGIHWSEPPRIVLGPRDETGWEDDINRPCVLKRGDTYHMWYTGQARGQSRIGYATSSDGVTWKRMSDKPVLSPDQPWEKDIAVMCPSLLWDEPAKLFRMWYSGGEQNEPNAIGYASSPDGLTWTKHEGNPIFVSKPGNPWEKHKVTACQVEKRGDWYIIRTQCSTSKEAMCGASWIP